MAKFTGEQLGEFASGALKPLLTEAYVVKDAGGKFVLDKIELPPLGSAQVEVEMTHCGLCHTDVHMQKNDWGISNFPLVAGHEGVGVIRAVGGDVKELKPGMRVGIGWLRDSCGNCRNCVVGRDNLCEAGYQGTYLGANAGCWGKDASNDRGCFSKVMRIAERFAFKIPDAIPSAEAAPLMCAGITMFEPIMDHVKVGSRVGIVGMGGLGHMGVKYAKAVGASVTAISRTPAKKQRSLDCGAARFLDYSNPEDVAAGAGSLDVIIDTTPVGIDIAPFMGLLAFGGTYCKVGIPPASEGTFSFQFIPLIFTQKKIVGSIVSGSANTRKMLDLSADVGVTSNVEVVKFDTINETCDRLIAEKNEEFRFVLEW